MKRHFILIASAVFLLAIGAPVSADSPIKMKVSHQPEFESFLTWQAIEDGVQKAHNLDMKMVYFDSGMAQVEALPAKQWDIGALGAVPMVMAALRYQSYMVGMTHDDAYNVFVLARPDSDVFKVKGANKDYPEMYGSAESVRGKTILTTTVSAGHYVLSTWLKRLGLSDSDVKILNMEQGQAVAAFESGKGDIVALWAPFTMAGISKGWKKIANGEDCGATVPLVIITSKEYGDKNPEKVATYLKMYFKQVDRQKKEGQAQAKQYQRFLKDWAGIELADDMIKMDIDLHPMYDLERNLQVFDASGGKSKAYQWMDDLSTFFTYNKRFKEEERQKVMSTPFITDKFLKMAAGK
jgi:NitT/TauT family transport system substrate-binding protein/sulfonate transport system substrate-binding protein